MRARNGGFSEECTVITKSTKCLAGLTAGEASITMPRWESDKLVVNQHYGHKHLATSLSTVTLGNWEPCPIVEGLARAAKCVDPAKLKYVSRNGRSLCGVFQLADVASNMPDRPPVSFFELPSPPCHPNPAIIPQTSSSKGADGYQQAQIRGLAKRNKKRRAR